MNWRIIAVAVAGLICCGAARRDPVAPRVQLEMRNVHLHVADGIVLDVRRMRGDMISTSSRAPVFDDQSSFTIQLHSGEMSMDLASLQNLLNKHVFAYDGSPLKDISVEAEGTRIKLKGKLHKGIDVPFSSVSTVNVTPEGSMRLHVDSMKAVGIPAKGLLQLFGLKLDDVMDVKRRRGVDVQDNDIIIAAGQVLPPPRIDGRLTRAYVQGNRLFQIFDDSTKPPALKRPDSRAPNYIYFGGGEITFGKLTMHGADLQLIDSDPKDPFDFFPTRYSAQLVAGYSKNTPAKGLKTYMPDYGDLQQRSAR